MWDFEWVPCTVAAARKQELLQNRGNVSVHCVDHKEENGVRYCKIIIVRSFDPPWNGPDGQCA